MKIQALRPPMNAKDVKEHDRIVGNMLHLRDEIRQTFTDIAAWNDYVRKPWQKRIDPDPDGQLRGILEGIDASLAASFRG